MARRQDSTAPWILPWSCSSVSRIRGLLCLFKEDSNRLSPITAAVALTFFGPFNPSSVHVQMVPGWLSIFEQWPKSLLFINKCTSECVTGFLGDCQNCYDPWESVLGNDKRFWKVWGQQGNPPLWFGSRSCLSRSRGSLWVPPCRCNLS